MSNKTFKHLSFIFLALLIVSCAAPESEGPAADQAGMLNPGDRLGEMEITTAEGWDWDRNLYSLCIEGNAENEALREDETRQYYRFPCDLHAGTQFLFSCSGVSVELGESLDEAFAKLETEMVFDGRALNLPAFGSLDFSDRGTNIRTWNVLLKNIAPGDHTLVCRQEFEEEGHESTWLFNVSEAPN